MTVEVRDLYSFQNNLFQTPNWLAFQESYGRKIFNFSNFAGIVVDLPFGKKAILVQKAPEKWSNFESQISNLPKNFIFVRVEPSEIGGKQIKSLNLKEVNRNSLLSGQASPKATRVLDLTKTEEELFAAMKPKTRYNIRLAEKKGVEIMRLKSDDILYEMLKKTAQKGSGYQPHEKVYYTNMIKELSKKGLAHVFAAKHQKDFLAAILVCGFGQTAIYLHGGQNNIKKNFMAPYLCQWYAIKFAKESGYKYYDFWGVSENDDPKDPWAGITRFKEGFGGEKVIFPGSFDYVCSPFWYNVFTLAARIKHYLRK